MCCIWVVIGWWGRTAELGKGGSDSGQAAVVAIGRAVEQSCQVNLGTGLEVLWQVGIAVLVVRARYQLCWRCGGGGHECGHHESAPLDWAQGQGQGRATGNAWCCSTPRSSVNFVPTLGKIALPLSLPLGMALWQQVHHLPAVQQLYGRHFPLELRHFFAEWLERQPWGDAVADAQLAARLLQVGFGAGWLAGPLLLLGW